MFVISTMQRYEKVRRQRAEVSRKMQNHNEIENQTPKTVFTRTIVYSITHSKPKTGTEKQNVSNLLKKMINYLLYCIILSTFATDFEKSFT